jgi:hypothetical protein
MNVNEEIETTSSNDRYRVMENDNNVSCLNLCLFFYEKNHERRKEEMKQFRITISARTTLLR